MNERTDAQIALTSVPVLQTYLDYFSSSFALDVLRLLSKTRRPIVPVDSRLQNVDIIRCVCSMQVGVHLMRFAKEQLMHRWQELYSWLYVW